MRQWMMRAMVVSGCLIGTLLATSPAEAQFLDWLFPGRACRRACRQSNTAWRVAYMTPSTPCNSCATPTTAYYGGNSCTTCAGNGCSTCAPVQTGWVYRPNVQYRTVWSQVPVTSYRPVSGSCVQPCTSYSWQARRVPYVTYRPMFAGLGNNYSRTTLAPVTGNYWTQFGSAGYSLPRIRPSVPVASCGSCPTGVSSAADVAPTLVAPATTVTSNYAPTTSYSSGWQPTGSCAGCSATTSTPTTTGYGATDWQPVTESQPAPTTSNYATPGNGNGSEPNYAGATEWKPVGETTQNDGRDLAPVPANRPPSLQKDSDSGSGMRDYNRYGNNRYRQPEPRQLDDPLGRRGSSPQAQPSPRSWSTSQSGRQPANAAPHFRPIPDREREDGWRNDLQEQLDSLSETTASLNRTRSATRWEAIPLRSASSDGSQPERTKPANRDGWRSAL